MKKIFLFMFALFMFWGVNAQKRKNVETKGVELSNKIDNKDFVSVNTFSNTRSVMNYGFEEATTTFTSISSTGTAVTPDSWDDGEFVLDLTGTYTFTYNLSDYSTFNLSTNGAMVMGGTGNISLLNDLADATKTPTITALWDDLRFYGEGTGDGLFYQIDDVAGEDVLTIEWNNIARYSYEGNQVTFQVKLYATSGNIEFVYGDMSAATNWGGKAATVSIGINDDESGASAVFASITPGSPATMSNSTANNTITGTNLAAIASGTVYRFVPNFVANDLMALNFIPQVIQPGVDTTFTVYVNNIGSSDQTSYSVSMVVNDGTSDVFTTTKSITETLTVGDIDTIVMDANTWTSVPEGTYTGTFTVTLAGDENAANNVYTAPIVVANTILMQDGIQTTCNSLFYDTGGPDNDFQNDEDYTLTVNPGTAGKMVKVDFSSFDCAGSSYDFLEIYNGASTSDPLLVSSQNVGDAAMLANSYAASNTDGALTFKFHSSSVSPHAGWEATLSCASPVVFHVTDGANDVEGAKVEINGNVAYTDATGNSSFVLEEGDVDYMVTTTFCDTLTGTYTVTAADDQVVDLTITCPNEYNITFHAFENYGAYDNIESANITVTHLASSTVWGGTTDVNGEYVISLPGVTGFEFAVSADGYTYTGTTTFDVTADATIDIPMDEMIAAPYALMTQQQNTDADVLFSWNNATGFSDDFESYDDFVLSFGDWTIIDVDGGPTYGFGGTTFANMGAPMAGIIFNPSQTDPALTDCDAHSGDKYIAIFNSSNPTLDDDWLIAPQTQIISGDEISYWARSGTDGGYIDEKLQVFVSTTTPEIASFTSISPIETTTQTWTKYTYSLDAYAGQNIYVAIHCTSSDQFFVCIDDFNIGQPAKGARAFQSYSVLLGDDEYATDIDTTSIMFNDLAPGTYTAKVFGVYETSNSDTIAIPFTVLANYDVTFNILKAADDSPIENAAVELTDGTETYNLTTDAAGTASQIDVFEGSWTYSVSATGFDDVNLVVLELVSDTIITVRMDSNIDIKDVENNINIYPNPSNGVFTVKVDATYNLQVIDVAGKVINTQVVNDNTTINIINSGVYFLRFSNENGNYVEKVIIK